MKTHPSLYAGGICCALLMMLFPPSAAAESAGPLVTQNASLTSVPATQDGLPESSDVLTFGMLGLGALATVLGVRQYESRMMN